MNPVAFIQANVLRIGIYGALILFYSALVWFHGYTRGEKKLFDYQAAEATKAVKLVTIQGKATERVVTRYIRVRDTAAATTTVIEKRVTVYAESHDGNCLDADWRRLHDDAATRTVSDATSRTDAASQAPTAAAALATVTSNYAACNETADRLDALQEWIREQAKLK